MKHPVYIDEKIPKFNLEIFKNNNNKYLISIGRQLRKSIHKSTARLYDIVDDLSWKKYDNHTLRHFYERKKIYDAEGFDYKIVKIPLTGERNEQNPLQGS